MDYLTLSEIAKKWGVSGRMAAYYCETGRIAGAIKKGGAWLVPAGTEKPFDKRRSRQKAVVKEAENLDITENDSLSAVFRTGNVYRSLGLTRETLRYYEEIGLIEPKRSPYSQYREFDVYDISRLMAIDFFKKRGFTPSEIHDSLIGITPEDYRTALRRKTEDLRREISDLQAIINRLRAAENFCRRMPDGIGEFSIRDLPPYCVQETLSASTAFEEYREKVLSRLDLGREDILSNMIRALSFDETGYKGSEIYVVKPAGTGRGGGVFLEDGRSLCVTLTDNGDASIMEKMFRACHAWAGRNGVSFRGVAYIFARFIMLGEKTDRIFYEVWVPIQ